MRGMTRRWIVPTDAGVTVHDGAAADRALVERILRSRGVVDPAEIDRFCDPRLSALEDPAKIPNAGEAADRIVSAIRSTEVIAIYGDYDVDGITATAILFHVIRAIEPAADVRTYVPHRLEEGYGLNAEALRSLRDDGVDLVISVDSGVTAVEPAAIARSIGLDLIITDHHELRADGVLPDALVVHPRLPGSTSVNGDLCGAGVAFKLAWKVATTWCGSDRVNDRLKHTLLQMLPLAALGTIADIVPLLGENRILTTYGLRMIRQTELIGLRALLEASDLAGEDVDAQTVGFVLGPRLNAIGRMGHAAEAIRLFTTATRADAVSIAAQLASYNTDRQRTERKIVDQACRLAETLGMTASDRRGIVLAHPDWHPGVVGIVASRLVDRFARPAILLQQQDGICKGSGRSVDGFNLHDALTRCAAHLTSFGGHHAAAGLALDAGSLDDFTEAFIACANDGLAEDDLVPVLRIDCSAALHELSHPAVAGIERMSPFGKSNRRPTLLVDDLIIEESPRLIGAHGKHLSVRVRQDGPAGRRSMRAIWWNAGDRAGAFSPGTRLTMAIEPKLNTWRGQTNVEAVIHDIHLPGDVPPT